jgi:phosphoglycolate phosphatase
MLLLRESFILIDNERRTNFMGLIIFDYDGVIADTLEDLLRSSQIACNKLGVKHSVTKDDLSNLEVMSFPTFGQACEVPEQHIDEFVRICLNFFAEKKSPPAIFTGMCDVIRYLAVNHRIVIVTTNTSQNVNAFLEKHNLADLIQAVYGVETPGSKVQKIRMAREQLLESKKNELVFMVGDSLSDILAAKEASVISIAISWGHQSLEKLQRGNPDFVVSSPHDLIEIIEQ